MTLYTNGNMTIAGTLTENSDIRLKSDIQDVDDNDLVNIFDNINVKKYTRISTGEQEICFLADEVEAYEFEKTTQCLNCSNFIEYNYVEANDSPTGIEIDDLKSLSYGRMCCILWSVVKEQKMINWNQF